MNVFTIKLHLVPRFETDDDLTMVSIPSGVVLDVISTGSPWYITSDGVMIPKGKAVPIKPLDTQATDS